MLSDFCMAFHSNCYFCMGFCSHTIGIALFLHGVLQLLCYFSMGFCSCILISAWGFETAVLFLHGINHATTQAFRYCFLGFFICYPIFSLEPCSNCFISAWGFAATQESPYFHLEFCYHYAILHGILELHPHSEDFCSCLGVALSVLRMLLHPYSCVGFCSCPGAAKCRS